VVGDAVFHDDAVLSGGGGVVVVRDVEFASTSDATLLPFFGRCHVAYLPAGGAVLGLSKLARLVRLCSRRIQPPAELARLVLGAVRDAVSPRGAAVVLDAQQLGAGGGSCPLGVVMAACGAFQASPASLQVRL
jgi:GTP cyclohydrolase I